MLKTKPRHQKKNQISLVRAYILTEFELQAPPIYVVDQVQLMCTRANRIWLITGTKVTASAKTLLQRHRGTRLNLETKHLTPITSIVRSNHL
jgi:hypothetical protein